MRIAYVTADNGIPVFGTKGASIHVREMVNAFATMGHEVTVVAAQRGGPESTIHADIVDVCADVPPTLESQLKGEDKVRAKETRSLRISTAVGNRIVELHAQRRFDLIYERYSLFSSAGVEVAKRLGIPCIVEVNSPLVQEQKKYRKLFYQTQAEAVEAHLLGNADVIVAVSEQIKTYVESKGASPACTHVVPNGVDIKRFHPSVAPEPIAAPDDAYVVGFAGSLKPWHGVEVLLDAFRNIAHDNQNAHLLIVGDGPLRQWVEGFAHGANIDNRVTVTGWIAYERLPALIQSMSVAVAPYPELDDFYFSPLKLYEYMAAGRAIVASRIGEIAAVLGEGDSGMLVPPGDVPALAATVEQLLDDGALRKRLGAKARARAVRHHGWDAVLQRILDPLTAQLPADGVH